MLTFSTHQKKKKWLIKPPGIKEPVKGFEPPAGGLQNLFHYKMACSAVLRASFLQKVTVHPYSPLQGGAHA
uniref:Uncharacterized protein n=1 Tax=Thermosporothrix sp. COM3 TaxID=2490863 RepID=A0A455SRA8_9CHLR|nr:hypothetical protein KTC_49070 [Thermosporothrix sp. COM3]